MWFGQSYTHHSGERKIVGCATWWTRAYVGYNYMYIMEHRYLLGARSTYPKWRAKTASGLQWTFPCSFLPGRLSGTRAHQLVEEGAELISPCEPGHARTSDGANLHASPDLDLQTCGQMRSSRSWRVIGGCPSRLQETCFCMVPGFATVVASVLLIFKAASRPMSLKPLFPFTMLRLLMSCCASKRACICASPWAASENSWWISAQLPLLHRTCSIYCIWSWSSEVDRIWTFQSKFPLKWEHLNELFHLLQDNYTYYK